MTTWVIKYRQNILAEKIWHKESTNEKKCFCSFSPHIGRQLHRVQQSYLLAAMVSLCQLSMHVLWEQKWNKFRMNLQIHFPLSQCSGENMYSILQREEVLFASLHLNPVIFLVWLFLIMKFHFIGGCKWDKCHFILPPLLHNHIKHTLTICTFMSVKLCIPLIQIIWWNVSISTPNGKGKSWN